MAVRWFMLFSLILCNPLLSFSQSFSQAAIPASFINWFDNTISIQNTELLNGPEYFTSFQGSSTHPFFGSTQATEEQLHFNGQVYLKVSLLYDIFSDIVAIRYHTSSGGFAMIKIDQEKVEQFSLYQHQFVRMVNPAKVGASQASFYDMLYDGGTIKLVAKRSKTRLLKDGHPECEPEDQYYFIKDSTWITLSKASDFYALMQDKKAAISNFIKKQKFNVRKKNEQELITIAQYCKSIS